MGLMSYLRNRAGLVVTIIGLAIVAFLLGDIINMGTPFWMKSQNQVGNVNGESIDYQAFNAQVDQTTAMYQQQMGALLRHKSEAMPYNRYGINLYHKSS